VRSVEVTEDKVVRPEGFDLERAWQEIAARVDEIRAPVEVEAVVSPAVLDGVRWVFGGRVVTGEPQGDARVPVRVRGQRAVAVAAQLAGFGREVEVLSPPEARRYLAQLGRDLTAIYGGGEEHGARGALNTAS
jgi:hypothetical protein